MFPMKIQEAKISDKVGDEKIDFAIGETQVGRKQMEDATLACYIKNNNQLDLLFGVFDGHGGQEVAIFCKAVFPTVLEWNM